MSAYPRTRFVWIPLLAGCLALTGCIETSVVVKVNKDGSGIVHMRNHQQVIDLSFIGTKAEEDEESKKPDIPTKEDLSELAKKMGEGVSLKSVAASTNRNGWDGYDVIFEFQDINQLVLGDNLKQLGKNLDDESGDASGDQEQDSGSDSPFGDVRFAMKGNTLEIRMVLPEADPSEPKEQEVVGAVDPFADKPASAQAKVSLETVLIQAYAKILADVRVGFFVEIDGEIESTNAMHRNDNVITLASIHLGEMLDDPQSTGNLKKLEALSKSPSAEKVRELADQIDGLDVDTQDPIQVVFQ